MNRQTFFYGFHRYLLFVHIVLFFLSLRLCLRLAFTSAQRECRVRLCVKFVFY